MWTWIDDHLSLIITGVVGIVAGFVGGVRMFLGLRTDVDKLSSRVKDTEKSIGEIQANSRVAAEQRKNIINKLDETNENVNRLIDHLLKKE